MRLMLRKILTSQPHAFQTTCGGGPHARHVQVQAPVPVKISQGMRHAKTESILTQLRRHIGKPATPIIEIHVKTGKVTDHHQIQIPIVIKIHQ